MGSGIIEEGWLIDSPEEDLTDSTYLGEFEIDIE